MTNKAHLALREGDFYTLLFKRVINTQISGLLELEVLIGGRQKPNTNIDTAISKFVDTYNGPPRSVYAFDPFESIFNNSNNLMGVRLISNAHA